MMPPLMTAVIASPALAVGGIRSAASSCSAVKPTLAAVDHRVPLAVVEHQHAPVRALEARDRRQDLLQDRRQLEAVGEPGAQGVQPGHVGELDRQLVPDRRELLLVALALDGRGQDVGHGLEEVDVVVREGPRPVAEDLERAERAVAAVDDDAQAADDAVIAERAAETANRVSVAEVVDDDRLAGAAG